MLFLFVSFFFFFCAKMGTKTRNGDASHRFSHQIPRQVKKKRRGIKDKKLTLKGLSSKEPDC
jgi:hypothetical protein